MHTGFDRKVWSATAKLTHSFSENVDFTYIGNYSKLDKNYIEDAGGGLFFFPFQTIARHTSNGRRKRVFLGTRPERAGRSALIISTWISTVSSTRPARYSTQRPPTPPAAKA